VGPERNTSSRRRRVPELEIERDRRRPPQRRRNGRHPGLDLLAGLITLAVLFIFGAIAYAALRPHHKTVGVTQTDGRLGQELKQLKPIILTRGTAGLGAVPTIRVEPAKTGQTYWGVGGAVTDSSAYLIHSLGAKQQTKLLTKLFSLSGLGLSFASIPIGASDYTAGGVPYTYDDQSPGQTDPDLKDFSIAHDKQWSLPVDRQIETIRPQTRFFAVTWTAPPWMKANDQYDNLNDSGSLLPQYYASFADYLVDFLRAYTARGIDVAAIAPENEPNSPSSIPSMFLPINDQETFIADDLAPALKASGLSTRIFGGDVGMPRLDTQEELAESAAGADLGGLAWHCYSDPPTQMTMADQAHAGLTELVTECAEKISRAPMQEDVLGSLLNDASGFLAWNLALTSTGGPVQEPNHGCPGCRGLVQINPKTGAYELSQQAYILGQVGHSVIPGAKRVQSSDEPTWVTAKNGRFSLKRNSGLLNVAFRNPDGKLVLIVYNSGSRATTFNVSDGTDHFTATLPAGAMTTFGWRD
jgi:glucosylceramidase